MTVPATDPDSSSGQVPEIDLCVPFWGKPADLRLLVDSVLEQDDPHWRLTVIDDCYPEDVSHWIAALDDPRIRYTRNDTNVGIVENFRRAAAAAVGPRVVILGSDDLLHPHYVRTVRSLLSDHPEADVLEIGVQVIDGDGRPVLPLTDRVKQSLLRPKGAVTLHGQAFAASLLRGNWLYWPSLVLRTEQVQRLGFRDDLPIMLDLALVLEIAEAGGQLHYDPTVCFSYRRHGASLSQQAIVDGTRFVEERRFFHEKAARAKALGWRRAAWAARGRPISRLHGLAVLPTVLRKGSWASRRAALALAFAP